LKIHSITASKNVNDKIQRVDIFLVHTGKFGCHFEGVIRFRHIDCRRASPNVGRRRFLIESAFSISRRMTRNGSSSWLLIHNLGRLICSFHRLEKISKNILFLSALTNLDLAQNGRIISRLEKSDVMPCSDCTSVMARKSEISAYLTG